MVPVRSGQAAVTDTARLFRDAVARLEVAEAQVRDLEQRVADARRTVADCETAAAVARFGTRRRAQATTVTARGELAQVQGTLADALGELDSCARDRDKAAARARNLDRPTTRSTPPRELEPNVGSLGLPAGHLREIQPQVFDLDLGL